MHPRARIRVIPPYSTAAALEAWERARTESVRGSTCEEETPTQSMSIADIYETFEGVS